MTAAAVLLGLVLLLAVLLGALLLGLALTGYLGAATGALTVDTGRGRRVQQLGPLHADIAAPRETVYALLTQPYLGRVTRALAEKVQVLERQTAGAGEGMVLAAHRTPIKGRLTAVTVETVAFAPPGEIRFRLVRGPVPHVVEKFLLTDAPTGCHLEYQGELGTDFGPLGAWWGRAVAGKWRSTVAETMRAVQVEAERRSAQR